MTEVILTTCEFVKGMLNVSENLSAKYLRPAINEAQEIGLRTILGDKLIDKLKAIVRDNLGGGSFSPESFDASFDTDHPELAKYIALMKRPEFQYYLAYEAAALVIPKVSYKIANAGVVRSTDEHVVAPSFEEVQLTAQEYQGKADFFCYRLQGWLLLHRMDYPEIDEVTWHGIRSNLYSAASCGIFLGGARGRQDIFGGFDPLNLPDPRQ